MNILPSLTFNLYLNCVYRQTPLHLAVLNNHEGAVLAIIEHKKLIDKGDMAATDRSGVSLTPNLNLKNSDGDTPVSLALTEGKRSIIERNEVIDKGDVNA